MPQNWLYRQSTGEMFDPDRNRIETGYAGAPPFVNKARAEPLEDRGPLPTGEYGIEPAYDHPSLGPCSLPLTPDPTNDMHGRDAFFIHGDNAAQDNTASQGCIILTRPSRDIISASSVRLLRVIV